MANITFNGDAGRLTVKVSGDLDRAGMKKMQQSLHATDLRPFPELVFDFTGVGFIGTSGISFILEFIRCCMSREQKVQVVHTPPAIQELFDSLHLDTVISYS